MATQRSIVDVLLRRLLMLCVATLLRSAGNTGAPPLQTLALAPLAPLQTCDSIGTIIPRTRRVYEYATTTKIKAYYKQNELGGAARAHGPRRVKTCGLSPI